MSFMVCLDTGEVGLAVLFAITALSATNGVSSTPKIVGRALHAAQPNVGFSSDLLQVSFSSASKS